jgi:two-component system alkaline phosphatase synthesis response regulator PhoP
MGAVLIVDDTEDCSDPLARLLRKNGHSVQCANNGMDALAALARFRPDVIILDLMMPVMDGVSFLEIMRRNPAWKDLRVIVFSGYGDGLPARRLTELGVGEIFLKGSIDFTQLLKVVA